ncbi:MAG: class II aldolase/adducin family protein [Candidatus Obscuribacterales bacterium]|nr:class II aldolase/adducin family protein [Candidatus Obscuribacterales bacterium]
MTGRDSIQDLVSLCLYAGERFDLVQAGGGNASFRKLGESLWVKASGTALSEVRVGSGICELSDSVLSALIEELVATAPGLSVAELDLRAAAGVSAATSPAQPRPSIETLLHALLGPFTLHTHPPAVTAMVCQSGWQSRIAELFPEALMLEYKTPGAALAVSLYHELKSKPREGQVIVVFLGNHGLIVAGETVEDVVAATDNVVEVVSASTGLPVGRYKLSNQISSLFRQAAVPCHCVYVSDDRYLLSELSINSDLFLAGPAWPDQLVYCGPAGLQLDRLDDAAPITRYVQQFGVPPKVIIHCGQLLLVGKNVKNCREIEEVLKAHVMTLKSRCRTAEFLPQEEVSFLLGWEAEKYRQSL